VKPTILYFGTPQLAVPPLEALLRSGLYDVVGVVTQPDKPAGRGKILSPSPVKACAQSFGIPVFQPQSLKHIVASGELEGSEKNAELVSFLNSAREIDIFIVVAYGKIIPKALIEFPRHGILNIHMSLLPRWRGAAPIQRALLENDELSGVTLMRIDEGLDTGPVYSSATVNIDHDDDSGTVTSKLVAQGCERLLADLPLILDGSLRAQPQSNSGVSYAEKLEKADFQIRWEEPAERISARVRAGAPHPGAYCLLDGLPVKVFKVRPLPNQNFPIVSAGTVVEATKESLVVAVGKSEFLSLEELQFPGKKRLPIAEILKGKTFEIGSRFA